MIHMHPIRVMSCKSSCASKEEDLNENLVLLAYLYFHLNRNGWKVYLRLNSGGKLAIQYTPGGFIINIECILSYIAQRLFV